MAKRTKLLTDVPDDVHKFIIEKQAEMMNKIKGKFGYEAAIYKIIRDAKNIIQ